MNREEYEHKMQDSKSLSESMLSAINYITSLEQRIAELEEDIQQRECLEIDATTTIRSLRECIAESEQRVKELEGANSIILKKLNEVPKTCEGCKWEYTKGYKHDEPCFECIRDFHDYYEPKEQK